MENVLNSGVQDELCSVQDVIDWLEQVKMLDELVDAKIAERQQWMELGTKMTPEMSGMPHAPGVSDKVGNAASRLGDLITELDEITDMFIDHKQQVINTLEKLPAEEYGVLHRHYIQYKTLGKVASEMNYSYMQVWRIKEQGLKRLRTMLGGE